MNTNEDLRQPNMIPVPPYEKLFTEHSVQRVVDEIVNSLDLSEVEATYKPGGGTALPSERAAESNPVCLRK